MAYPVQTLSDGSIKMSDGTIVPPMSKATPDLSQLPLSRFIGPRKVTTGVTDQYQTVPSQKTAGYIKGEEISPLAQKRAVQEIPESVKRDMWKQVGGLDSNFDINAFDKDPTGKPYIKAEVIKRIQDEKAKTNLFDFTNVAGAEGEVRQSKNPDYVPPSKGFIESMYGKAISSPLATGIVETPSVSVGLSNLATNIENKGYADKGDLQAKKEEFVQKMLDAGATKDQIQEAINQAKAQGKFQGGILENPITGTLASAVSMPIKALSTATKGYEDIGQGLTTTFAGDATTGLSQIVKGGTEAGLGTLQGLTSATPAGYLGNVVLLSEPAQAIMQPVMEAGQGIAKYGQEALGYNPESEASKNIQEAVGNIAPILATKGAEPIGKKVIGLGKAVAESPKTIANAPGKIKETVQTSKEFVPAKTEAGTEYTIEKTPGLTTNLSDKLAGKSNEILAQQSVFPKATKEKGLKARQESSKTALEGIKQLHEDKAKGIVNSDIKTMQGGVDGISEALDHYGKQIGELTKSDVSVPTLDLVTKLKTSSEAPFSGISAGMKSTVDNIVKEFEKVGNKATISDLQTALSNIKSEIFSNHENVAKLYKTNTGKALNEFLKDLESRFDTTIENTSGNSALLKKNKSAYSKYKKIQKDLTDSLMVELRNQGKGVTGTAGKIAGLYEVLSNPTMSGIMKAVALKQAGEFMQYYKSRSGNYETLIRNLDREAVKRVNPKK